MSSSRSFLKSRWLSSVVRSLSFCCFASITFFKEAKYHFFLCIAWNKRLQCAKWLFFPLSPIHFYSPHSARAHCSLLLTLSSSSCRAALRCRISTEMAEGRLLEEEGTGPGGGRGHREAKRLEILLQLRKIYLVVSPAEPPLLVNAGPDLGVGTIHDCNQDVQHQDGHHDLINCPVCQAHEVIELKGELLVVTVSVSDVWTVGILSKDDPPPHRTQEILLWTQFRVDQRVGVVASSSLLEGLEDGQSADGVRGKDQCVNRKHKEDVFENTCNTKADRSKRIADDHHAEKRKDLKPQWDGDECASNVEKIVSAEVRLVLMSHEGHRQETNCHGQVLCKVVWVPKALKEALDWDGCKGHNVIDKKVDCEKHRDPS